MANECPLRLTQARTPVTDHDALEVDGCATLLDDLVIVVVQGAGEDGQVSALKSPRSAGVPCPLILQTVATARKPGVAGRHLVERHSRRKTRPSCGKDGRGSP